MKTMTIRRLLASAVISACAVALTVTPVEAGKCRAHRVHAQVVAYAPIHYTGPAVAATAALPADIVDTAVSAKSFGTLVAAVKAAGLVEILKGDGPFTVFAPTDEAFAKLPKETLESLLKPENKEQLKAILTYHIIAGQVAAADVVKLKEAKTVNGKSVKITVADGGVSIDNAKVTKTDIHCKNGVIHVIDTVILPAK